MGGRYKAMAMTLEQAQKEAQAKYTAAVAERDKAVKEHDELREQTKNCHDEVRLRTNVLGANSEVGAEEICNNYTAAQTAKAEAERQQANYSKANANYANAVKQQQRDQTTLNNIKTTQLNRKDFATEADYQNAVSKRNSMIAKQEKKVAQNAQNVDTAKAVNEQKSKDVTKASTAADQQNKSFENSCKKAGVDPSSVTADNVEAFNTANEKYKNKQQELGKAVERELDAEKKLKSLEQYSPENVASDIELYKQTARTEDKQNSIPKTSNGSGSLEDLRALPGNVNFRGVGNSNGKSVNDTFFKARWIIVQIILHESRLLVHLFIECTCTNWKDC